MSAEEQLRRFIARFAPANRRLLRGLRATTRRRLPQANELVYDNYNFLVIAYSPSQRAGDSYFSIGADKNGASLFFGYTGTKIDDPKKLLQGRGALNRFIRLDSPETLERPEVMALIESSIASCKPMGAAKGKLFIRSISSKQRPRR